eukprot:5004681-Pleurochrysis_carterae.AAC.1
MERMARSATPLLVDVRRACGVIVVAVKGTHDALGVGRALVKESGEGREEAADVRRSLRFVLEEVHGFEA